ncbi:MAG: hypothetical protein Q9160_000062 [Pyrenula sp. 1 TL-2023]
MPSSPYPTPTILLVDLPPKTFCGIDLLSFNSSPNFLGIKDISLGLHFLFTGVNATLAVRHGRWIRLTSSNEVLVFGWSPTEECLAPVQNGERLMRWRANLGSVWSNGLLSYSQLAGEGSVDMGDWKSLTSYISYGTLDRILGNAREIGRWTLTSISSGSQDIESIPGLSTAEARTEETELGFIHVDTKRTWPPDAVGRDRTKAAQDFSWYLSNLIEQLAIEEDKKKGAKDLLGEFQFNFLMVLCLSNYSCLQQWKRLLDVFTGCKEALAQGEEYFLWFLKLLKLQLTHLEDVDGGLFDMGEDGAALLKSLATRLRKNVDKIIGHESKLSEELARLEGFLREQYGWDLNTPILQRGLLELEDGEQVEMDLNEDDEDEETGEYAPTVVDLSQHTI